MEDDGANDQRQKELSISHAASSMINASDTISEEAYQANLKRIQEVKEMVRRLEMNNETAHKNFLVSQLEKRAKDGREAEIMLSQLRNQPGIPESVQFPNNVPRDKSEVILPTTATLVEVPESHSSHSLPAPTATSTLQTIQQGHLAEYHWSRYNSDNFRHYTPPSTIRQSQHSVAPRTQAPVDGQGWHTTQDESSHSRVHISQAHQPSLQSIPLQQPFWGGYPPPVIALPTPVTVPMYYSPLPGRMKTAPTRSTPNTSFSNTTFRDPSLPMQFTAPPPHIATQPQNPVPLPSTSQVQPGVPTKISNGQPFHSRSHSQSTESRHRTVSTTALKPMVTSEPQRSLELPPQPQQQLQQRLSQPQQLPQPPQPPQQPQRLVQPLLQPRIHPQHSQELPSQRPLQPPQTHAPQSIDHASFSSVSQPNSHPLLARDAPSSSGILPTQLPRPSVVQEQRNAQPRLDQATFIRLFQNSVQGGILQLKAFFHQAKASGISDEWFRAAINSLPRGVWESLVAQVNQSKPTPDLPLPTSVPQVPGPSVPVVSVPSSSVAVSPFQTTPAIQQTTKPSISTDEKETPFASGETSGSYAVQLQYYAEQATKTAQLATTPSGPTQGIAATPTRDASQVQVNVRTPKDANKTTLARDVLRSLGKVVPKASHEVEGKPKDHNYHVDQLPEVNPAPPVSHLAPPEPPEVPPMTSPVYVTSPSIPSTKLNEQTSSQYVAPTGPSATKHAIIEGPVMIDLTLEDSDGSVDGKGLESEATFPIQTCASAATSSQPVSPVNTTNHTPLLQNLSLEESSIDGAAGGDNVDVRMYSPPPLPPAAKENMEPKLLHSSLGSVEPVLPGSGSLPSETSEHPLDGQLPLFLPSPPDSPVLAEPPETVLEMVNDGTKAGHSLKRRSVDEIAVDIDLLTPPCVRKRQKRQVYVLIPPAPPYVIKARKMKERAMGKVIDSDTGGEDEEFQYSDLEQLLIEESKSRLSERRCRWLNCGAVLNCSDSLLAHLRSHAREEESQAPFLCCWASCRRQFKTEQERSAHLETHAVKPLPCPFAGCDEEFNKPLEVMQHEVQHQKAERREPLMHKPTYQPIVPAIPSRLGPPPYRLPSHRVIPRRVVKCRISADRHAIMGPWILWNIFSPVDLHTRKQNASMRGRQTRQAISYDVDDSDPRRDDYDFLLALSYPAKNAQFDDLNSTLITMSAARGLTLWGTESIGVGTAEGKLSGSEIATEVAGENDESNGRQPGQVIGEEGVVEPLGVVGQRREELNHVA